MICLKSLDVSINVYHFPPQRSNKHDERTRQSKHVPERRVADADVSPQPGVLASHGELRDLQPRVDGQQKVDALAQGLR